MTSSRPAERPEPAWSQEADPAAQRLREVFGRNVRRARMLQRRSLRDLAEATHVSPGMLSQIERGLTNPTLDTMARLTNALRLPLTDLVTSQQERPNVVRAGAGPRWVDRTTGQATVDLFHSVRPAHFVISHAGFPAGAATTPTSHGSGTLEYAYVITGSVRIDCDDWTEELLPGDAIQLPGHLSHRYAAGAEPTELIIVLAFDDTSRPGESHSSTITPR